MTQIVLTGISGQVGWELQRTLMGLGEVTTLGRSGAATLKVDLEDGDSLREAIRTVQPDLIVNAAAYTAVDRAEVEPDRAIAVNVEAPAILAQEAKHLGAALIHYSTDYVFDGTATRPYREEDAPNPQNTYGKTKLAGEQAIQASGVPHLILRTSWVYGLRGKNFLLTMLRLGQEREELKVVNDQVGTPTWSRVIAEITGQILTQAGKDPLPYLAERSGIYHLTGQGQTSWYGFAQQIFAQAIEPNRKLQRLLPIASSEYPTAVQRPAYSCLSNERLAQTFGLQPPRWQKALALALEQDNAV